MDLSGFNFIPLSPVVDLSYFDSDDKDINDFLINDSINYQDQKMGNTYLFLKEAHDIVAYFTISNDCLNDLGEDKGYTNNISLHPLSLPLFTPSLLLEIRRI